MSAGRPISAVGDRGWDRMAPVPLLQASLLEQRRQFVAVLQVVQAHPEAPDVEKLVLKDRTVLIAIPNESVSVNLLLVMIPTGIIGPPRKTDAASARGSNFICIVISAVFDFGARPATR